MRHRKRIALVIFLVYLAALTFFLLAPRPQDHLNDSFKNLLRYFFWTYVDPVTHLVCFTMLGFLASLIPWRRSRQTLLILLMTYGALTEIVQYFVPSRSAEWGDLIQDMLGIATGMVAASYFLTWWRARYKPPHLDELADDQEPGGRDVSQLAEDPTSDENHGDNRKPL